jgi:hypothetical protein
MSSRWVSDTSRVECSVHLDSRTDHCHVCGLHCTARPAMSHVACGSCVVRTHQRSAHVCLLILARVFALCLTCCCADWDAVIRSDLPLKVVASSLTSLRSEVLDNFTDRGDLVECLKASANVPEIVGGPRSHRGHQLVDAAVFEPLPIKAALRCAGFVSRCLLSCTHTPLAPGRGC